MIYTAVLERKDGTVKKHSSRPSKRYLNGHPEFVRYTESGYWNEFLYTTVYDIVNGMLVEVENKKRHERELGVCNF